MDIERWGIFEYAVQIDELPKHPFLDVNVEGEFSHGERELIAPGFYDGEGRFIVRFSPDEVGEWRFTLRGDHPKIDGKAGCFRCVPPAAGNHGPIRAKGRGFQYADGTPFYPLGTTAYAWTYQDEAVVQNSLESFSAYGFNKVRMLVMPKEYGGGAEDIHKIDFSPEILPFAGNAGVFDFTRPNPAYFHRYETRVRQLLERGIMAEIILFHPYDQGKWGIPQGMSEVDDRRYIRYLLGRLSCFRNIWWSLANEYDLFGVSIPTSIVNLRRKNWKGIGELVQKLDYANHPRSIHNWTWGSIYPDEEWMTHTSYQHPNTWSLAIRLVEERGKPVVNDEYQYEGNVLNDYGNCSAELVVKRHWMLALAGAFGTHGELYFWEGQKEHLFWTTGGTLQGESPKRLNYLRGLMERLSGEGLKPDFTFSDGVDMFCAANGTKSYLRFFAPNYKDRGGFHLGDLNETEVFYDLEIHDVWACRLALRTRSRPGSVRVRMPAWCVVIARKVGGI